MPRNEQGAYLDQAYKTGGLSKVDYERMMSQWRTVKKLEDEEAAMIAQMTPFEKAMYLQKKREIELQEQSVAAQQAQAYAAGAALTQQSMSNMNAGLRQNSANLNNSANAQVIANGQ